MMKIAVSTADGVSICGHLGMCSLFIVYEISDATVTSKEVREVAPVHGPTEHGNHDHHASDGHNHGGVIGALSDVTAVITNGMGGHFATALQVEGINPVITTESDPDAAVRAYLDGTLEIGSRCNCGGH